jgi:coenzyme F420-reducing hydrogenase alpha subunit
MSNLRNGEIHVPVLARVEGEGALDIRIRDGQIDRLHLRIFELPRLFEKLLEGRSAQDVIDSVARICGICPVAYQITAVAAIESVFNFTQTPWVQAMRRVMYCGEWIQSHSLHIHLLAAPDFLGFNSAPAMAQKFPLEVPVGVRPGGFFHAPNAAAIATLRQKIHDSIDEARDLIAWVATLPVPEDEQNFTSVSLRQDGQYPIEGGRIVSDAGLDIAIEDYEQHFRELQVPYSTALHALLDEQPYLVGPLARINNNYDCLPAELRGLIAVTGIQFPSQNMFHSMLARAIEIYYAMSETLRLTENYEIPPEPYVEPGMRAGVGYGCTEAPRGILWHRYVLDEQGHALEARIVPPTSQNQARMEEDLKTSLTRFGLDQSDDVLRLRGEMVIRNYDPCISCATHFLDFRAERQ